MLLMEIVVVVMSKSTGLQGLWWLLDSQLRARGLPLLLRADTPKLWAIITVPRSGAGLSLF